MKKIVFLKSDMHKRDSEAYLLIKDYLEKTIDCKVFILSRINTDFLYKLFGKYGIWILPTLDVYRLRLKSNSNKNLFILQTEGFVSEEALKIDMRENYPFEKIANFLVWNDFTKNYLLTKDVPESKIHLVGSPRLPLVYQYLNDNSAVKIGVLGRFDAISSFSKISFMKNLFSAVLDKNSYMKFAEFAKSQIDDVDMIFKYTKEHWNKLYFRPHPNEDIDDYTALVTEGALVDEDYSFLRWASKCKIIISPVSTSCIEFLLLNKTILRTRIYENLNKAEIATKYFEYLSDPLSEYDFHDLEGCDNKNKYAVLNEVLKLYYNNGVTRYDLIKDLIKETEDKRIFYKAPDVVIFSLDLVWKFIVRIKRVVGLNTTKNYHYSLFSKIATINDTVLEKCINENGIINCKEILEENYSS